MMRVLIHQVAFHCPVSYRLRQNKSAHDSLYNLAHPVIALGYKVGG
nr:hypothetical protein [Gilliamella apicola]